MRNAPAVACFLISLVLAGFGYGVATMHWKIFPYELLNNARQALEAWGSVLAEDDLPNGFAAFVPEGNPLPATRRLAATGGAGSGELLLVTGGPYQLMSRCPAFGCLAWVMDRDGRILHTWEVDLDELWGDMSGVAGLANKLSIIPVGLHLLDGGELIISFQGRGTFPFAIGIARVGRDGDVQWKRIDYSHHWFTVDEDGRIYTPALRLLDNPVRAGASGLSINCRQSKVWEDIVRVLSPDGEVLDEISMLDAVAASGYAGLLFAKKNSCDPTHLNATEIVGADLAGRIEGISAGDLVVSLHAVSALAVLDGDSHMIKHVVTGRTAGQHGPRFLPDGDLLVFDNFGGREMQGGSRILRLDLGSGNESPVFPREDTAAEMLPFSSDVAGHLDISEDGTRALISVTEQGRIVEIDIETGSALWEYDNTHDIGAYLNAAGLDADTPVARFQTLGAYYVENTAFVDDGRY